MLDDSAYITVDTVKVGDQLFYRYYYDIIVYGEVTYVADDLKSFHITGSRMVDAEGNLIPRTSHRWFPVEGFIYWYKEKTRIVNGETRIVETVNKRASPWRRVTT